MNKYRIEIGPQNGSSGTEVYEGYYGDVAAASCGALLTQKNAHPIAPHEQCIKPGDTVALKVKLLKTGLNRSTSGCKRVQ